MCEKRRWSAERNTYRDHDAQDLLGALLFRFGGSSLSTMYEQGGLEKLIDIQQDMQFFYSSNFNHWAYQKYLRIHRSACSFSSCCWSSSYRSRRCRSIHRRCKFMHMSWGINNDISHMSKFTCTWLNMKQMIMKYVCHIEIHYSGYRNQSLSMKQ